MDVVFFASPSELRAWLDEHYDKATELWVGFNKKASGKGGITYAEALDEALCYGWIDGVRKRVDETSFTIRFSPRKVKSVWSAVNINRVGELSKLGLMQPPGLKTFEERDAARSGQYSYEREAAELGADYEKRFQEVTGAWDFFQAQPPSYRRAAIWWVISAKREETRLRRLATLMEDSANGRRLAADTNTPKP